ncbi:MAG: phosphodiester glycosidase family protein [Elusimicrobiota bacterium]
MRRPLRSPAFPLIVLSAAFLAALVPGRARAARSQGYNYYFTEGYHVVIADLDSKSVEVRVAMPKPDARQNKRTVAQHAQDEGAAVAVNANFFGGPDNHPCGMARGYGVQYPATYGEAVNCETTLGWSKGKGAVFNSAGRHADAKHAPQFSELVTGGGALLVGGVPRDWNHRKLEEHRACTAAGLSADRKKLILVVSGPSSCTGKGLQRVLAAAGAADAVHLDGGGSSKMWLRGKGYVNGVQGDRAPPVVIVVKAAPQKCPADCGSAPCVELPPPFGAQCLGRECRNGLGAIWNCELKFKKRLRCEKGRVASQDCAMACLPKPDGQHDVCSKCPAGNGLYCGKNLILNGDRNTLYRCSDGALSISKKCGKCEVMPPGVNDKCK